MQLIPNFIIKYLCRFYMSNNSSDAAIAKLQKTKLKPLNNSLIKTEIYTIKGKMKYLKIYNKKNPDLDNAVLYTYGGGFVLPITNNHYKYIHYLIKKTNAVFYVPIYPLSNKNFHGGLIVPEYIAEVYKEMLMYNGKRNITVMGDSSGATLSLSLHNILTRDSIQLPNSVILLSPCMRMDYTQKIMEIYANLEIIITPNIFRWAFDNYIDKKDDRKNPLISPYYGYYDNIKNLHIYCGDHEAFTVGILEFCENILDKNNIKYNLTVGKNTYHIYPLFAVFGIKQSILHTNEICNIILNKNK